MDVTIEVSAFHQSDKQTHDPLFYQVLHSSPDGDYHFSYTGELESEICVEFTLSDDSPLRTNHYTSYKREIFLSSSNPAYNRKTHQYIVSNNDFNLYLVH